MIAKKPKPPLHRNPDALHYPDIRLLNFLNPQERKQIESIGPFDASASNPPWGGEARTVLMKRPPNFSLRLLICLKKAES